MCDLQHRQVVHPDLLMNNIFFNDHSGNNSTSMENDDLVPGTYSAVDGQHILC